jgi:protein required for attachment to host cells
MSPQAASREKVFWVVVADESTAIVYAHATKSGPLHKVFSLTNEAARMKTDELISDSGGRSFDSKGKGRHTMGSDRSDPKKHAAEMFAKEIAERIARVMHDGSCRDFALIAAPRFLGVLREAVSVATSAKPYATVDKQVVAQDTTVIEKLLAGA